MKNKMTEEEKKIKIAEYNLKYKTTNKELLKEKRRLYRLNNKDELNKRLRKDRVDNPIKYKVFYKKHNEKRKDKLKIYNEVNREKITKQKLQYEKLKRETDPLYKFKKNTRNNISKIFLRNGYKKKSTSFQILGCDYNDFVKYIESQFDSWMNWSNYGNKTPIITPNTTWDLDHIIPLASTKTEDDVIRLNHYTNFQPLCSYINRFVKQDNY